MREIDITQLSALVLGLWFPFVRIMAFMHYVPVFDNSALTVRVRIILSLSLAIIITPLIPHPVPTNLLSMNSLILTVEQIAWGMLLALPTTFIMLVVQGSFGLLNRISPALNLYSLGFPINMLAGMVCFGTLIYNLPDHYLQLADFVLQQLDALKGHYGG